MRTTLSRRHWLARTGLAAAAITAWRTPVNAATGPGGSSITYLDQNENPYGISKQTERAILDAVQLSNRYPDDSLPALGELIARRENVPASCVVLGAGCTEIFSLACLLYGSDGKAIVAGDPTYSGFVSYAERLGARLERVPTNDRWELNLDEMSRRLSTGTRLVYVCNPNNPTGTIVEADRLRSFCESTSGQAPVFVDESYHEFAEDAPPGSMVELVRKGRRLIVGRSFSKLYGLAGLRVGYGITTPETAAQFRRIQTNFAPLSQLSIAAARAVLADAEFTAQCRQRNAAGRAALYRLLERLGYTAITGSQANFVTFEVRGTRRELAGRLQREHRIVVRQFQFANCHWVRVSIGTPDEMEKLAAALEALS